MIQDAFVMTTRLNNNPNFVFIINHIDPRHWHDNDNDNDTINDDDDNDDDDDGDDDDGDD